jgi:formate hydrogenlyase subunit 6/NADH:ubiquinone oxidoreductase subunit I
MNVFEIIPDEAPIIARQHECQTCFMCELYCPVDALYVHPDAQVSVEVNEAQLIAEGKLGAYSKSLGWKRARAMGTEQDQMDRLFEIGIY